MSCADVPVHIWHGFPVDWSEGVSRTAGLTVARLRIAGLRQCARSDAI